jgi:hypothetical protein
MPPLKIATNPALSIAPKKIGVARRLLCDARRLNLSENKATRLRERSHAPKTHVPLEKKLDQTCSLETSPAALGDILFTQNLRRYIHDEVSFVDHLKFFSAFFGYIKETRA